MICERCGTFFCLDYFEGEGTVRYCGKTCKRKANTARTRQRTRSAHAALVRSCTGKRQYYSEQRALAVLQVTGREGSAYECGLCGCWHLTSKTGERASAARQKVIRALQGSEESPVPAWARVR